MRVFSYNSAKLWTSVFCHLDSDFIIGGQSNYSFNSSYTDFNQHKTTKQWFIQQIYFILSETRLLHDWYEYFILILQIVPLITPAVE